MMPANFYANVTEQGRASLEDALCLGIVLPTLLAARTGWSAESVRKTCDTLVTQQKLRRFASPLDGRAAYYALSPGAAACLGVKSPPKTGYVKKGIIHRGLVALFLAKRQHYAKITAAEFARYFPNLFSQRSNSSHYIVDVEDPDVAKLGWIVIDDGERDPKRLASKAREEYGRRFEHDAWRKEWILSGRFFLTILTGPLTKAAAIQAEIDQNPPHYAPVHVEALEDELDSLSFFHKGA